MKWIWIVFTFFFSTISRIYSIQTRIHRPIRFTDESLFPSRQFRHIDSSSDSYAADFDWEDGLREATVQALLRERVGDGNLKRHIYSAPLLGKQNKATPFGDIAMLARGQLYANYAGFIFVQDPNQNECDDCHNIDPTDTARERCITHRCQIWRPKSNEKLIALWIIRRIRHRSRQDGLTYEVEFTISPVGLRYQNGGYLTKDGTFNYNLPGHLFVLKSSDGQRHLEHNQDSDPVIKHGAFIAQTPDGRKYILHSFNGLLTPESTRYYNPPRKYPLATSTTSTPQSSEEKNIYQTLLEVLHKKTSPESRFTPPATLSDKTLVQLPDGQVIPMTELTTPFVTKTTPSYVTVGFPETDGIPATPGEREHKTSPMETTTRGQTLQSKVTPQSYGIIRPQTTSKIATTERLAPQDFHTTTRHMAEVNTYNEIPPSTAYTKPSPFYTTSGGGNYDERPQTMITAQNIAAPSTKPPFKMTFHYFAAEEATKTNPDTFKKPLTTTQGEFTEYENILHDTLFPTKLTVGSVSQVATTELKTPSIINYPTESSTKQILTTKMVSTKYNPGTIMKVTKPVKKITDSYFNIQTTGKTTKTTTEPSTKVMPSIAATQPSTFKVPITVLEEFTVGSTIKQNKYPTTHFEEISTVTSAPKTTYTTTSKYTTLQFYNSPTTLLQAPPGGTESKESTKLTKIPTLEAEKELTETTLGVTKVMGSSQNKTTEMVYYTAEENTLTIKQTTPISAPTEPTYYSSLETKTTIPTTPKRIVTTIQADGTVSIKTTPISTEEELFGATKGSTKKYTRPPQLSTTSAPGDFLVDEGSLPDHKVPLYKKPLKDYSEDDIFGSAKSTTAKISDKTRPVKHYTKSDLEEALFDTNNRKSKALIRRKPSTTEATPNVIYSDFFEASTIPMTTPPGTTKEIRSFFNIPNEKRVGSVRVTTETVPIATTMTYETERTNPVTSQSYLTSISYEVNKRKRPSGGNSRINSFRNAEKHKNANKIRPNESIIDNNFTTQMSATSFEDDFALRLVGHAKGAEYLGQLSTTLASTLASTSAKTTKKSKYIRRRSYVPKAKRPTRTKVIQDKGTQL